MVGILILEVDFSAVVSLATLSVVEESTDSLSDIFKIGFFVDEFLEISLADDHSGSRQNFEPETYEVWLGVTFYFFTLR